MKSKPSKSTIRAVGQRSISSTLLFRPHPPNQISSGDAKEGANLGPPSKRVSFSNYLNRRLHSNSVLPLAAQNDRSKHIEVPTQSDTGTNGVIEESVFKQFNLSEASQEDERNRAIHADDNDEVEEENVDIVRQGSRKRRNAFEEFGPADERSSARSHLLILGDDVSNRKDSSANKRAKQPCDEGNIGNAVKKHLVVLGDDPKPRRCTRGQSSNSRKQPKDQYNHYENGAGWWDYNKEGVDNDEVGGATEVWEGVGSTTLGEIIDWH